MSLKKNPHIELTPDFSTMEKDLTPSTQKFFSTFKKKILWVVVSAGIVVGVNIALTNNNCANIRSSYKNKSSITKSLKSAHFHQVKTGDTLYSLAKRYKTTVNELMKINKLDSSNIKLGKKLIISPPKTTQLKHHLNLPENKIKKQQINNLYHKIKSGDTLYSLSRKYKTTVSKLMKINNLDSFILKVWERLKLPNKKQTTNIPLKSSLKNIPSKKELPQANFLKDNPFLESIQKTIAYAQNSEKNPIFVDQQSAYALEKELQNILKKVERLKTTAEKRAFLTQELTIAIDNQQLQTTLAKKIKRNNKEIFNLDNKIAEAEKNNQNTDYAKNLKLKLKQKKNENAKKLAYVRKCTAHNHWEKIDFKANKYASESSLFDQLATVLRVHNARNLLSKKDGSIFYDQYIAKFGIEKIKKSLKLTTNHSFNKKNALLYKNQIKENYHKYFGDNSEIPLDLVYGLFANESLFNNFNISSTGVTSIGQTIKYVFGGKDKVSKKIKHLFPYNTFTNPFNPQENIERTLKHLSKSYQFAKNYRKLNDVVKITFSGYNRWFGTIKKAIATYGSHWHEHLDDEGTKYLAKIIQSADKMRWIL